MHKHGLGAVVRTIWCGTCHAAKSVTNNESHCVSYAYIYMDRYRPNKYT